MKDSAAPSEADPLMATALTGNTGQSDSGRGPTTWMPRRGITSPVRGVLDNFRRGFDAGLTMKASGLFILEYIGLDQIGKLSRWLAEVSPDIPFHIMGYIRVPGAPWRGPTSEEMADAVERAKEHLAHVTFTHLTPEQAQAHRRHHDEHEERVL